MDKTVAVIVAGGSGKRMGGAVKKQYILLRGKEVLARTVDVFEACEFIDEIIVVVSKDEIDYVKEKIVEAYNYSKIEKIIAGGAERQDSVYNGLKAADKNTDYVIVHDGARPFITKEVILKCLEKAKETGASIVGVPVKDTIKICNAKTHIVEQTPDRNTLWTIQTPQIFSFELLMRAYEHALAHKLQVTDDSMIAEAFGKEVYITQGEYSNIKVTTPEDLIIGEAIIDANSSKNVEKGVDL